MELNDVVGLMLVCSVMLLAYVMRKSVVEMNARLDARIDGLQADVLRVERLCQRGITQLVKGQQRVNEHRDHFDSSSKAEAGTPSHGQQRGSEPRDHHVSSDKAASGNTQPRVHGNPSGPSVGRHGAHMPSNTAGSGQDGSRRPSNSRSPVRGHASHADGPAQLVERRRLWGQAAKHGPAPREDDPASVRRRHNKLESTMDEGGGERRASRNSSGAEPAA